MENWRKSAEITMLKKSRIMIQGRLSVSTGSGILFKYAHNIFLCERVRYAVFLIFPIEALPL
jgi:hypothetical protein